MRIKSVPQSLSFAGSSPTPFVGRYGYPSVQVGMLATPTPDSAAAQLDDPRLWSAQNYSIMNIADLRTQLLHSRTLVHVKKTSTILPLMQEVSMASRPVELEVSLKKKPVFKLTFDSHHAPTGPLAELEHARITANSHIPTAVQKVVSDTDLLAASGCQELYNHGFDEHALTKLLSTGSLGTEKRRRLVPTRWAITATDDLLCQHVLETVKQQPLTDAYRVFVGGYLGNYYVLLFFPHNFQYELFETYVPTPAQYSTDYENFGGRTSYVEQCAGGYYAPRLAISEYLAKTKRQASVLALRFITTEYTMPLGVWVTREATRKALVNKPLSFSTKELALTFVKNLARTKFGIDIAEQLNKSKLLKQLQQKRLF